MSFRFSPLIRVISPLYLSPLIIIFSAATPLFFFTDADHVFPRRFFFFFRHAVLYHAFSCHFALLVLRFFTRWLSFAADISWLSSYFLC